jgi:hypothetical protein
MEVTMLLYRIVDRLYKFVESYPEILPVLGLMALVLGVAIHFA